MERRLNVEEKIRQEEMEKEKKKEERRDYLTIDNTTVSCQTPHSSPKDTSISSIHPSPLHQEERLKVTDHLDSN